VAPSDGIAKRRADVPESSLRNGGESPPPVPRGKGGLAFHAISQKLARLEEHLRDVETKLHPVLAGVQADWIESARNLVHYAALRQHDLRELQLLLQQHGLSSLGRSESFVMASLLELRMRVAEAHSRGRPRSSFCTAIRGTRSGPSPRGGTST
jgi:hypothetical protein